LPTLWIFNTCKRSAEFMRRWRWEEYIEAKMNQLRDSKNRPEEKWSHINMVWEACFKHPAFKARKISGFREPRRTKSYFHGRR